MCGPFESPHASVRETSRSGSSRERLGREIARRTFTRARGRVAAAGARGLLNVVRTLAASVIRIKNNPSVVSRRSQTRSRCHRRKALLRVKLARARSVTPSSNTYRRHKVCDLFLREPKDPVPFPFLPMLRRVRQTKRRMRRRARPLVPSPARWSAPLSPHG